MQVLSIGINFNNNYNQSGKTKNASSLVEQRNNKPVTFGWCWPHITAMESLNDKFTETLRKTVVAENNIKNNISNLNKIKSTRYSLLDDASAKATQLFAKYSNIQYTASEMLPTYALKQNKVLQGLIEQYEILNNPVNILIAINNVTKIGMKPGIDKNTMKPYTTEQTQKAKAGTQLYTTILLMEQLDRNLEKEDDSLGRELLEILKRDINSVYGEKTYERVISLSNIGNNPTLEQKRASVNLIKEFDEKSKELSFSEEFLHKLEVYIEQKNIQENRTIVNSGSGITDNFVMKVSYHTHPQEHLGHSHEHVHHHAHGQFATEEEHMQYHMQQQKAEQERLK